MTARNRRRIIPAVVDADERELMNRGKNQLVRSSFGDLSESNIAA
jgi:hypothetical protein